MKDMVRGKYIKKLIATLLMCVVVLSTLGCSNMNLKFNSSIDNKILRESWIAGDGSEMEFDKSKTFKWYQKENEYEDNYYSGTYELYSGDKAIEYLVNDDKYGLTEERLNEYILNRIDDKNKFILINLNNTECIVGGENKMNESVETPFMGFYIEDEESTRMEVLNLNAFTVSKFTKK